MADKKPPISTWSEWLEALTPEQRRLFNARLEYQKQQAKAEERAKKHNPFYDRPPLVYM